MEPGYSTAHNRTTPRSPLNLCGSRGRGAARAGAHKPHGGSGPGPHECPTATNPRHPRVRKRQDLQAGLASGFPSAGGSRKAGTRTGSTRATTASTPKQHHTHSGSPLSPPGPASCVLRPLKEPRAGHPHMRRRRGLTSCLLAWTRPASLSRRSGQRTPWPPGAAAQQDPPACLSRPKLPGTLHPRAPAALTHVAPFLAVAEALEGALGSGLRTHACGRDPRQPQVWPPTPGPAQGSQGRQVGRRDPEGPRREDSGAGMDTVAYPLEAGPWAAGREVEATSCQRTGRSPSPRRGEGRSVHGVWLLSPVPMVLSGPAQIWSRSRSRARVPGGERTGCPGADLSPGLTWAAARTFWDKLFPWRGSGGPENTVGRARVTELSGWPPGH